jgi:hypothetical protein
VESGSIRAENLTRLAVIRPTRAPSIAAISQPTCCPLKTKPAMNISPIMALALSVKLSVKATTNRRKFWRFNPNSLYFSKQFANFLLSESMQQTVPICG